MNQRNEFVIIKLGGSIVVPDGINVEYLKAFRDLIHKRVALGERFAIIVGGGRTSRTYQQALTALGITDEDTNNWLAIHALRVNCELVRMAFGKHAYKHVINTLSLIETVDDSPVVIVGAEEPGHSTDFDAVKIATLVGAQKLAILSNIEYIYDSDPKKNPDARKFDEITWKEYRSYIPESFAPNQSTPIDPVASALADTYALEVAMMNGTNLDNFEAYLEGRPFLGTRVHA